MTTREAPRRFLAAVAVLVALLGFLLERVIRWAQAFGATRARTLGEVATLLAHREGALLYAGVLLLSLLPVVLGVLVYDPDDPDTRIDAALIATLGVVPLVYATVAQRQEVTGIPEAPGVQTAGLVLGAAVALSALLWYRSNPQHRDVALFSVVVFVLFAGAFFQPGPVSGTDQIVPYEVSGLDSRYSHFALQHEVRADDGDVVRVRYRGLDGHPADQIEIRGSGFADHGDVDQAAPGPWQGGTVERGLFGQRMVTSGNTTVVGVAESCEIEVVMTIDGEQFQRDSVTCPQE